VGEGVAGGLTPKKEASPSFPARERNAMAPRDSLDLRRGGGRIFLGFFLGRGMRVSAFSAPRRWIQFPLAQAPEEAARTARMNHLASLSGGRKQTRVALRRKLCGLESDV
jgi:hypothetical protein